MPGSTYSGEDPPRLNVGKDSYNHKIRIQVCHVYGVFHQKSMYACTWRKQEAVPFGQIARGNQPVNRSQKVLAYLRWETRDCLSQC